LSKGQTDVGQSLLAAPPVRESLAEMARQVRGHRPAMRGGEQSDEAVLALLEVERGFP
jgi:antitoxin component of MazEF toxin-antitoxin module